MQVEVTRVEMMQVEILLVEVEMMQVQMIQVQIMQVEISRVNCSRRWGNNAPVNSLPHIPPMQGEGIWSKRLAPPPGIWSKNFLGTMWLE